MAMLSTVFLLVAVLGGAAALSSEEPEFGLFLLSLGLLLLAAVDTSTRRVLLHLVRPAEGAVAAYLGAWVGVAQTGERSGQASMNILGALVTLVALALVDEFARRRRATAVS